MVHETITLEGHLIDSDIMRRVFDRVVEEGGEFEVLEFRVGRTQRRSPRSPGSRSGRRTPTPSTASSRRVRYLGADHRGGRLPRSRPPRRDGILPDEFYSTTNFDTFVRIDGRWVEARGPEDGLRARAARRRAALREAGRRCRKGEPVALRGPGIRVRPPRAQPRLRRLRLHVERRLGRDQQGRS